MITNKKKLTALLHVFTDFSKNKDVSFFDIETTGFSAHTTSVYLIGCVYYENESFQLIQWFAQNPSEEALVIHSFFSFLRRFKTLVHFNGDGFDIPYLLKKCQYYQLNYNFDFIKSIDLYKIIAPYKKQLKLLNAKQKTIEEFLNVKREDTRSGGELIAVYLDYLRKPREEFLSALLLHNYNDVIGIMRLLPMLSYKSLFQGHVIVNKCEINTFVTLSGETEKEAIFSFTCHSALPKQISYSKDIYYLTCQEKNGKIKIKVYTRELKYFFPNYKDYYYLPLEDTSIHKSVAFYVDKNFRTKAKAANCYSKKTGRFLPQQSEIMVPYFKQDYHDKQTYFEITQEFLTNRQQQQLYVQHVLSILEK